MTKPRGILNIYTQLLISLNGKRINTTVENVLSERKRAKIEWNTEENDVADMPVPKIQIELMALIYYT